MFCVPLQSECRVQSGHDGSGSKKSEGNESRPGRHRDFTASKTHLQPALQPWPSQTGTATLQHASDWQTDSHVKVSTRLKKLVHQKITFILGLSV